ncbi:hypothetical protein [Wolbachia endosymbiont (group A) of Agelastica alni]|uniref:hypothetical protein n=1 Tax=Wolbachia endosymbiont (group A) of Agelastica alni TaxID=3066130 RepID=UPI003132E370
MKITEYLHYHDKGAGEGCQVGFSFLTIVNMLQKTMQEVYHFIRYLCSYWCYQDTP